MHPKPRQRSGHRAARPADRPAGRPAGPPVRASEARTGRPSRDGCGGVGRSVGPCVRRLLGRVGSVHEPVGPSAGRPPGQLSMVGRRSVGPSDRPRPGARRALCALSVGHRRGAAPAGSSDGVGRPQEAHQPRREGPVRAAPSQQARADPRRAEPSRAKPTSTGPSPAKPSRAEARRTERSRAESRQSARPSRPGPSRAKTLS